MTTSPNADGESNDGPRIRRQEVVADLGQQALETDDLDELLHAAAAVVAETVDAEYASVLELLPGGEELRLRRGVGWPDDLVGSATIPADSSSYAGEALRAAQPIVVEEPDADDRFIGSDGLGERDVSSGLSVSIGPDERPWGFCERTRPTGSDRRSAYPTRSQRSATIAAENSSETGRRSCYALHSAVRAGSPALAGAGDTRGPRLGTTTSRSVARRRSRSPRPARSPP